ncbi:hypothetical protein EON63_14570 [archaeon]|nr:MAG: hypothetical protein EON63_14570 [archaeon]
MYIHIPLGKDVNIPLPLSPQRVPAISIFQPAHVGCESVHVEGIITLLTALAHQLQLPLYVCVCVWVWV